MRLTAPHAAVLAKQILFPFILQYQYKFNLFFSTKWLFAQLTLIYYSHTLWLGHTRAPVATRSSHFASISPTDNSYTLVSDAVAVTGRGYFVPKTLATYQGRVTACWSPVSLTIPGCSEGGQHGSWHSPLGGVTMTLGCLRDSHVQALVNLPKSLTTPLGPKAKTCSQYCGGLATYSVWKGKENKERRRGWGRVWRANAATSKHSWDIRRGFQPCFSTEACRPRPCDHASLFWNVCIKPGAVGVS